MPPNFPGLVAQSSGYVLVMAPFLLLVILAA